MSLLEALFKSIGNTQKYVGNEIYNEYGIINVRISPKTFSDLMLEVTKTERWSAISEPKNVDNVIEKLQIYSPFGEVRFIVSSDFKDRIFWVETY